MSGWPWYSTALLAADVVGLISAPAEEALHHRDAVAVHPQGARQVVPVVSAVGPAAAAHMLMTQGAMEPSAVTICTSLDSQGSGVLALALHHGGVSAGDEALRGVVAGGLVHEVGARRARGASFRS